MIDGLYSFEAEESSIGYLFNPAIGLEKKANLLEVLSPEHFVDKKMRVLFTLIKLLRIFDKIVLWDKISANPESVKNGLEVKDISDIDEFVTEEDVKSYIAILTDKLQKRRLYDFGEHLKRSMLEGEDQYNLALQAQNTLLNISTKMDLESNEHLLEKVLNEKQGDILSTGYRTLDDHIGGYTRGMIVTLAGDSGHMKTTFALDSAFRMAEHNKDAKIAIFSKEMLAVDLMKKQIARICKIPVNKIFGQDYDKKKVRETMMNIEAFRNDRIRIINPSTFSGVTDIAKIQMTHKFDIWFLDFIQLLEFSKGSAGTASDFNIQIGQNMRNLQSLALGTKSVGIVLSQVKKGIEYRAIKKPTISDIEWSGLIKQLSSYIFFSYYPSKYYGELMDKDYYYLIGEKARFAETFIFPMKANGEYGTFQEVNTNTKASMLRKLKTIVG